MAKILFKNNASSFLATAVSSSDTTISVQTGTEVLFPFITETGDFFMCTLVNVAGDYEIVKVTQTNGNVFTVERAQEGTTALSFEVSSLIENRLTAESLEANLNNRNATNTEAGIIRIATDAEAEAGVDELTAINPKQLQEFAGGTGAGKVLGEIFKAAVPAGFFPQGAVKPTGFEYTEAVFPQVIKAYEDGELLGVTYEDYEAQIAEFGRCVAFAIDTVGRKFRVPTLKDGDSLKVAMSELEIGKSYKAGLPNITGTASGGNGNVGQIRGILDSRLPLSTGCFTQGTEARGTSGFEVDGNSRDLVMDASLSSDIYQDNVDTVLTEHARLPYFVQIANAGINESLINWSEFVLEVSTIESFRKSRIAVPYLANEVPNDPHIIYLDGREVDLANFPETLQLAIDGKLLIGNTAGTWQLISGTRYYCPNHVGRWYKAMGVAGTLLESGLPNIIGGFDVAYLSGSARVLYSQTGAFYEVSQSGDSQTLLQPAGSSGGGIRQGFDASRYNTIYGKAAEVQPYSITQIPLMYLGKLASEV